jgi:hypothetical protein
MDRWARTLLAILAVVGANLVEGGRAEAGVTCSAHNPIDNHPIAGADGTVDARNDTIDGVQGTLQVPNWTTANLRGQTDSAADVVLNIEGPSGQFYQLGWFIASGGGALPQAPAPMAFFGEGTVTDNGVSETLTPLVGVPMSPNFHAFRLLQIHSPDPYFNLRYQAFVDGSPVWTSTAKSSADGTPGVVGETNWDCADMYEYATRSTGAESLYAHHYSNNAWNLWNEHWNVRLNSAYTNPGCWGVGRLNNLGATSYAWDLC